jgi:hypothetical protein
MTEAQLSKGSGAAPKFIRGLIGLGIVPSRDGEHPFVLGDIHRVRLAQAFERSGISLQAIGTAIASGQLSFDVDQMFIYHAPLTGKTFREIAEDLDLPLETLTRLYAMRGLPRPAPDDVVREDEAATFSPWKAVFPQRC